MFAKDQKQLVDRGAGVSGIADGQVIYFGPSGVENA